jgi:iron complex transport system substrate-binding protein
MKRSLLALLAGLALTAQASDYPVTVRSCDRDVTFDHAP